MNFLRRVKDLGFSSKAQVFVSVVLAQQVRVKNGKLNAQVSLASKDCKLRLERTQKALYPLR